MIGQGNTSIAEHSFRAAIIGYFLSKMEGANADKVLKMLIFHDLGETRVGDINNIEKRYIINFEKSALKDIMRDTVLLEEIYTLFCELEKQNTKEAMIAKDADILEELLEEKELYDSGNKRLREWMLYSLKQLTTKSGILLGKEIVKSQSDAWWKNILLKPSLAKKRTTQIKQYIKNSFS